MRALRLSSLLGVCLCPAFATLLQYTGEDPTRGQSITIRADGVNETTFAGMMNIVVDGLFQRQIFCVDWDVFVDQTDYQSKLGFPNIVNNGTRVAWLLENALPSITTQAGYAGLQLAIWDIVTDNGNGMTAGRLRYSQANLSDPVLLATNNFLSISLNRASMNAIVYTHVAGKSVTQQFMGAWATSGPVPVPEPATWAFAAASLTVLAAYRGTRRPGRSKADSSRI